MFKRVAIIGLGLIGGSIGLALHNTRTAQYVVGYDMSREACEKACRIGAIDEASSALVDTVRTADLVILATPVGSIRALLSQIASVLVPETVVTDVASTKAQVVQWAKEDLPDHVAFVGGHPMAGKEVSGIEGASATLFRNCIYCVTPTTYTTQNAIRKACALVEILEARACFLDPVKHDQLVASVSHLPFLASVALMKSVASENSWPDASILAANGFRDVSRLAAGSPAMYRDICLTNSEAIVSQLDNYIATLYTLREKIAAQDEGIYESFVQTQRQRNEWQIAFETHHLSEE